MTWFTGPRWGNGLVRGRWLSPRAERVLVDVLAVLVGVVGELSLLYDDESPVRPVTVLLTVTAGTALLGRRGYPVLLPLPASSLSWVIPRVACWSVSHCSRSPNAVRPECLWWH
jgi:hypothetical protein